MLNHFQLQGPDERQTRPFLKVKPSEAQKVLATKPLTGSETPEVAGVCTPQ